MRNWAISMKRLILPLFILGILLIAFFTRWQFIFQHTYKADIGDIVVRWKVDRWTGQRWVETYGDNNKVIFAREKPCNVVTEKQKSNAWKLRTTLSWAWAGLFGMNLLWFLMILKPFIKEINSG